MPMFSKSKIPSVVGQSSEGKGESGALETRRRYKGLVDEPDMNVKSTGLVLLMNERCRLLDWPREGGGNKAWNIEESGAETPPLPLLLGCDTLAARSSADAREGDGFDSNSGRPTF